MIDDVVFLLFTGTGAGLGAYVANALRDTYPTATLMNHCVWPYESGEVIVQSYNTLLTLSSLLDASDGVCIVKNEELVRFYFYLHTILVILVFFWLFWLSYVRAIRMTD